MIRAISEGEDRICTHPARSKRKALSISSLSVSGASFLVGLIGESPTVLLSTVSATIKELRFVDDSLFS